MPHLAPVYVWEDARVCAHWNHALDTCLSYLGPVSYRFIQCPVCPEESCDSSGLTSSPLMVTAISSDCNHWWLWYPLFTGMTGNSNSLFLKRQRKISSSRCYNRLVYSLPLCPVCFSSKCLYILEITYAFIIIFCLSEWKISIMMLESCVLPIAGSQG